jgi:hypothetical protein
MDLRNKGTVRELLERPPGQTARLHVVLKRYKNTFVWEADPWDHEAPLHISTPSPLPATRPSPVAAELVAAEPIIVGPVRRKSARFPGTTLPRCSQRRRKMRKIQGIISNKLNESKVLKHLKSW